MLWTLLTLTSSGSLVAGAVVAANHSRLGIGGYAFAITIGLLLGGLNFWATEKVAASVVDRLGRHLHLAQESLLNALYFAAALWILLAILVGEWITSAAMHVLF